MWYKTGSITVTNGSTTVSGAGTAWISNAAIGEALYAPDGKLYEITNIASDTSITITPAYLGATASAQPYVIVPSQSYIRDLAAQAADLVNNYSTIYNTVGAGKFGDGTLAAPGIRFTDDLDTGFYRSASNEVTFVAGGVAQFKYNTSGLQLTSTGGFVNLTTSGNTTLGDAAADTVTINGTPTINAPTSIVTNSATNALRITQTGTGNALLVEDSANPDATPFVVNAGGTVVVGNTTAIAAGSTTPLFQVQGNSGTTASIFNWASSGFDPCRLVLAKSQSGTVGTRGVVANGTDLGNIRFMGDDGTAFIDAANILAEVDGTPGTNDMPGRLVFSTTADGASSPTEALRIDSRQQITIGGNAIAGRNVLLQKTLTGSTNVNGFAQSGVVQSDVTGIARGYRNVSATAAAAFTVNEYSHFYAEQGTIGAGSSIGNQYGFIVQSNLTGATNNYGFHSSIASGTGRYNFYAAGTAANVFAGTTHIGGSVGAESLRVTPVASAVNYLNVVGSATGNGLGFSAQGTDTNINLVASSKGSGSIGVYSNNFANLQFNVAHTASAVNYVQVTGGATDGGAAISTQGSDANIPMLYQTKGVSGHIFSTNGTYNPQLFVSPTASAVNYLSVTGSSTGNPVQVFAAGSDTNISIALTPKGTGGVGIGTSSPSSYGRLAVMTPTTNFGIFGVANSVGGGGGANLATYYGTAKISYIDTTLTNGTLGAETSFMAFATANSGTLAEKMRITSDGNLLVGTTDSGITTGAGFKTTNNAQWLAVVSAASTSALSNFSMYSTGAGAYRFYVGWDGTINATSATISAISDQRLKENIRDLELGLDAIMSVKPRRFDWKEGKGLNKKDDIGFIAQEFETVFPDSVSTSLAGSDGIDYKTVNHGGLIPALVKAIQELKAEFDAYKLSHP
jgi:hypothetical protein